MWNPLVHLVCVLSLEHGISETSGKHKYLCYDGASSTATSASRMHLLPKQILRRAAQQWTGRPTGEREEKCIIEDVPSDTLVIGNYKVQSWDIHEQDFLKSAPGLGMFVTVTSPSAEVILSKLYGPQGTFSFTSYLSGEYIICFQSNYTRLMSFPGSRLRIHLDIRVGEHFLDESVLQAKDKVNEVNMRLEHLIEQIHHVSKEQNYEREREEKFRKTSEETNSSILWWAIVQTIILISVGIWQIKSLRDFLISKKLV